MSNAACNAIQFQVGHVGLNVSDLDRSKKFYQQLFNLELIRESTDAAQRFAYLSDNQGLMLTLWQQSDGEFATDRPGLHHLAFLVGSIDRVQALEQRLKELETPLFYDGVVAHAEGAASGGLFFSDPDGIRLEIYSLTGADEAAAPSGKAPTCGFF